MRQDPDDSGDGVAAWRPPGCDQGASSVSGPRDRLDAALSELHDLSLVGLAPTDLISLLDTMTTVSARMTAATCRLVREADRRRLADDVGARNSPTWWAHRARITRGEAGRTLGLAERLETDLHTPVAAMLAQGRLHADQAGVIIAAVDALPDRVTEDLRGSARDRLLELAREHDARALRILGKGILDVLAPEIAESEEQKRLEEEEARANAKARITFVDDGHGQWHGRFTLHPTSVPCSRSRSTPSPTPAATLPAPPTTLGDARSARGCRAR